MAIAAVGTVVQSSGGSGTSFTLASHTYTSGNFIVLWVDHEDATPTVTASGGGNTFTRLTQPSPDGVHGAMLYAYNITGGTFQISISLSVSTPYIAAIAQEYSGLTTTDPLDQQNTGWDNGSPSTLTSTGTITTTQADEIIFAALGLYGSQSIVTTSGAGANWTPVYPATLGTVNNYKLVSRIVSATGTFRIDPTAGSADALQLNASQNWVAQIASFKAAAAGGGGSIVQPSTLTLMGVQ